MQLQMITVTKKNDYEEKIRMTSKNDFNLKQNILKRIIPPVYRSTTIMYELLITLNKTSVQ